MIKTRENLTHQFECDSAINTRSLKVASMVTTVCRINIDNVMKQETRSRK